MNVRRKILGLMAVFGLAVSGLFGASPASAASLECEAPLSLDCTVTHPDGIQRVYVAAELGNLFDKTYDNCPETVDVDFDAVTPIFEVVVVPCKSMDIADGDRDGREGREGHDPDDLKPDGRGDSEALDAYTKYCLKKFPTDPNKAGECIAGQPVE